jgi:hypothetical protein
VLSQSFRPSKEADIPDSAEGSKKSLDAMTRRKPGRYGG